jgi:hypothetical protein
VARLAGALALAAAITACKRTPAPGGGGGGATGPFVVDDPALVARNNEGVGLMGHFEYGPARDVFAELSAAHPDWLDVRVNEAIATFNRQLEGDEAAGLAILEDVLARDAGHLRANYCAGLLRLRLGRLDEAGTHFRRVAEGDPADAYAAYFVGQCLEPTDPEAALARYERAIELDPYLRSAYYRAFQLHQRQGRADEGRRRLDEFQRLEKNPRARIVEIVYTKMGPKAEALAVDLDDPPAVPAREGPKIAAPEPLLPAGSGLTWTGGGDDPPSLTACDLDGDGRLDLFAAGAVRTDAGTVNAVLRGTEGGFAPDREHPLAAVPGVNAALWGDYDNDGLTDVYLCRTGANMLMRRTAEGEWENVTAASATGGGGLDTVDGALVDADHDGDLDILCANADGPDELFSNNLDGTFRAIAAERGIDGGDRGTQRIIAADLDADRDLDLVVVHDEPPHAVYRNDRLWRYEPARGFEALVRFPMETAVVADLDADGQVEVIPRRRGYYPVVWGPNDAGAWAPRDHEVRRFVGGDDDTPPAMAVLDVAGAGRLDVVWRGSDGWERMGAEGVVLETSSDDAAPHAWAPVVVDPARGPDLVGLLPGAEPLVWRAGPGRHPFATLAFTGREDVGQSMRSNASGIGARAAVRVGSRWTVVDTLDTHSGPGQSLQPVAVGLGDAARIDFVAIDWSDGLFQSELDLAAGQPHVITETQRQVSSCPVLFAWDGQRYRFVSDVLGVGGIGFLLAPGTYTTPRPRERFLMPPGALAPRDGRLVLKLTEPMEEACYLDAATLAAWDLPPGWRMTLDERMGTGAPAPTGAPIFFRDETTPVRVTNDRGADVTDLVHEAGDAAAPVGELDRRFIGRLADDHVLTLDFDAPLDRGPGRPVLVADGWIEYPYSQTMFAAWQAGAAYRPPTLEARGADGVWRVVHEQFGYPAGMPRPMALPLDAVPAGVRALRLSTNQEIYWDRVAVAWSAACPEARRQTLPLRDARLSRTGFATRTDGDQRRPHYDYERRVPVWDTRHMRGHYTRFGPVTELVSAADDALAIFGPGEEVHLEFAAPPAPPPDGWTRRYVLEATGWCKDMDLFTRDGETLGPLPATGADRPRRDGLHARYNTRYASGR